MEIGLRHTINNEYYPLARTRIRIGSDPRCDIVIDCGQVDPHHVEIRVTAVGIEIDDLNSSSGTLVNEYRIDEHFLSQHDLVTIGPETYKLEFHSASKASAKRCERCGVELDSRMTRRISRSLIGSSETQTLCDRCVQKAPGQPRAASDSVVRQLQNLNHATQRFRRDQLDSRFAMGEETDKPSGSGQ